GDGHARGAVRVARSPAGTGAGARTAPGCGMNQALIVSNVVLWVVVVLLAGTVAALVRQIGVLYERVAPAGALMVGRGPAVGETGPGIPVEPFSGATPAAGGPRAAGSPRPPSFPSPPC